MHQPQKGACIVGQSGGPTSVINASLYGVIKTALESPKITRVLGAEHGIRGVLDDRLIDLDCQDSQELALLPTTPSSALGSVRYKIADPDTDETDFRRILEIFQKYNVRYFFYIGGNDSMDTCSKINRYMNRVGYDCCVMGVPKTIDNDLFGTDHCPGYGSAAKYIATTLMEVSLDASVYDTGMITTVEIMGRNAGWLTAASALASARGLGPDLIYLPERPLSVEQLFADVQRVYDKKQKVLIAVSEGVKDPDGRYLSEYGTDGQETDAFGHTQMGGLAAVLTAMLKTRFSTKLRGIELSLMQRCAAHCAAQTDIDEAFAAGEYAVRQAISGKSGYMAAFAREQGTEYVCRSVLLPLDQAANTERKVPQEWITPDGCGVTQDFLSYALPLIAGEPVRPMINGLPRFCTLNRVYAR